MNSTTFNSFYATLTDMGRAIGRAATTGAAAVSTLSWPALAVMCVMLALAITIVPLALFVYVMFMAIKLIFSVIADRSQRGVPVALAICADTSHQQHPHAAVIAGATLYVAGSVITPGGYAKEQSLLSGYAKLFSLGILLANHATATGGYQSAGRSAIWLPDGQLLIEAPGPGELLVVGDEDIGSILPIGPISGR